MMKLLLKREGFAVAVAPDGPEALRRDPAHHHRRIIAVSGHGRDALPEPSPFDHHLMKPVDHAAPANVGPSHSALLQNRQIK